jgi:hypothetical protein
MTRKIYKSAMGKTVDLGALLLQNEQVRAVGNMGVNAAGDLIDSTNRVIDQRNRQVQRQYKRQTNVSAAPVASGTMAARNSQSAKQPVSEPTDLVDFETEPLPAKNETENTSSATPLPTSGGLAAAIARNREIKQELEKTMRQRQQEQGLKKI